MIAKLEGTHSWNGGAVVLNDLDVWPRFELSKINGLGSIGDTDDQRSNRQGRRGENVRPALRRGKTVSYEGTIHARSLYELRQAEEDLLAGFDPLTYGGLLEGNLVTNPSFEVDTAGWQGTSAALSSGGAIARSTMSSSRGAASGRVTTTAATSAQGVAIPLGTLPFGRTYQVRLMIRMTNLAGTTLRLMAASQVDPFPQLIIANPIADENPGGYVKVAGSFVSNDTSPWHLIIRTNGAAAVDFYIDEVQVVEAASAPDYFDGDSPGARWEGVPHASISRLDGGLLEGQMVSAPHPEAVKRNLVTNPSFEVDTAGWAGQGSDGLGATVSQAQLTAYGRTNDWAGGVAAPGAGAGGARFSLFLRLVNSQQISAVSSMMNVSPGETLSAAVAAYASGPVGATVAVGVEFFGPAGFVSADYSGSDLAMGISGRAINEGLVVPAGATTARLYIYNAGGGVFDRSMYIDQAMLVGGPGVGGYFDGYSPGARWEGPPHASISRLPDTDRTFRARPLSCIVPEEQTSNEWKRPFAVTLRLSDPRVFWPAEIPLAQSPGTAGDSSVAISNLGRTDADPVLEVVGPTSAAWSVENTTLARSLRFTGFALTAGQAAVIDFTDRTIKLAGADQSTKLDLAQSDWWDRDTPGLAPGANTITLKPGVAATAATRVGVRYRPADPA